MENRSSLKCQKMNKSEFLEEDLSVNVSAYRTYKSMLVTYQTFEVKTLPIDFVVERTFSQFLWLRNHLVSIFPHYPIPMLPELKDKYQEDKTELKTKHLSFFINGLMKSKTLRNSKAVLVFLKEDNQLDFKSLKNSLIKRKRPKTFSDFNSVSGEIKISEEDNQELFFCYQKLCGFFETHLGSLAKQANLMLEKGKEFKNAAAAFAASCEQLSNFEWHYSNFTELTSRAFNNASEIFQKFSDRIEENNKSIENHIHFTLNWAMISITPLKNLISEYKNAESAYIKQRDYKESYQEAKKPIKEKEIDKYVELSKMAKVFNYYCEKQLEKSLLRLLEAINSEFDIFIEQICNREPFHRDPSPE